jgi:AAA domain
LTTRDILVRLDRVRKSGAGWTARCPSHEDKKNSLSISEANGKPLLHCFAGCTFEQIMAAIGNINGQPHAKTDAKPKFAFTDAEVTRLCEALIDEWAAGGAVADFLRSRGIDSNTSLMLRLGATQRTFLEVGSSPALAIPLYHGSQLVGVKYRAVIAKDHLAETGSNMSGLYGRPDPTAKEILLVEGPPDVALAMSHGFNAVGIQAADTVPTNEDVKLLGQYPTVFLIGDNDAKGIPAMDRWQLALNAVAPEAGIRVRLGYKDIGDLYAADPARFRITLATILRHARASREYFDWSDLLDEDEILGLQPPEPYVVENLIPAGAISMMFGEEKSGKSLLSRYIGKCVANGISVFGKYAAHQRPVLAFDLENNGADIKGFRDLFTRLGAEKIRYRTRKTGIPALDSRALLRLCERHRPLIILDSMTKFLAGADPFHPGEMSAFFDKLLTLCAAGATVLVIHHATRADAERYANSHQIGANVARSFLVVSEDRPRLQRVRFEGQLFRTGEPVTENLVAFPVITQTGHFGLADSSITDVDRLVEFVRSRGGQCSAEDIKSRKGIGRNRSTGILAQAIAEKRLTWPGKGRPVSIVRDAPYDAQDAFSYAEPVRPGTE